VAFPHCSWLVYLPESSASSLRTLPQVIFLSFTGSQTPNRSALCEESHAPLERKNNTPLMTLSLANFWEQESLLQIGPQTLGGEKESSYLQGIHQGAHRY